MKGEVCLTKIIEVKNKADYTRIILLVTLSVFQQLPIIRELFYEQIRILLYILFGILVIVSLNKIKKFYTKKFFLFYSLTFIYTLALEPVMRLRGINYSPFIQLGIPIGIMIISFGANIHRESLNKLLTWFVFLVSIMGLLTIFYYGEGFTLTEQYMVRHKNQIGPMLGFAAIILFDKIFNSLEESKIKNRALNILSFIIIIATLLAIRNRSGIVTLFFIFSIYLFINYRPKVTKIRVIIIYLFIVTLIILLILRLFDPILTYAWNSLTMNYDVGDLESLSAGRVETYIRAINFSRDNFVLGELGGAYFQENPHNYVFFNWVRLGIVGSIPLVLFYLYLWFYSLYTILLGEKFISNLSAWLLLFSLIVSIFEYTYPYGPGVSQLILWFLLGYEKKYHIQSNKL